MIGGAKGIGIGIDFGIPNQYCRATNKPYIEKDVLDSLRVVASAYGKTNNYSDRAIVKNLVDPDNPFVISNASYTDGSGYADKDSPYYGAFVTDGIDDLITSTKTVQEMLGGSNEITVMSMIHQIADRGSTYPNIYNNQIRYSTRLLRSTVTAANVVGKTGIYGYTATGVSITGTPTGKVVNDILGDKNDYPYLASAFTGIDAESHFSVEGYLSDSGNIIETSQVAWYWTIIANKVLTTDQINQVIAYFNLDRTLNPDILCNTIKQGITNENHAEFGDKLIDFSGNGRDIQLNNIAWDGDSGIGKYNYPNWKVNVTQGNKYARIVYYDSINGTYSADFKGITDLYKSYGLSVEIRVNRANTIDYHSIKEDGIYTVTPPDDTTSIDIRFGGENIYNASCDITITQIPSHAGALCLDGVNDFGQFVGDLELKDYTFIADRAYSRIAPSQVPFIASTQTNGQAPFLMEYLNEDTYVYPHSFGTTTKTTNLNIQRQISYQSTYVYNGNSISKGTSVDTGDGLTIGNSGSTGLQYSPLCLWSLMLFPYSMSEFLIERQLKKHKLGTLYADMVEFRPIVKSNLPYSSISYSVNPGEYISVDSMVTITVTLPNTSDKLMEVSCNAISDISISGDNGVYEITGKIVKSPQKINLVISSYLTMLSNSTLISNETLIKNE